MVFLAQLALRVTAWTVPSGTATRLAAACDGAIFAGGLCGILAMGDLLGHVLEVICGNVAEFIFTVLLASGTFALLADFANHILTFAVAGDRAFSVASFRRCEPGCAFLIAERGKIAIFAFPAGDACGIAGDLAVIDAAVFVLRDAMRAAAELTDARRLAVRVEPALFAPAVAGFNFARHLIAGRSFGACAMLTFAVPAL